MAAEGAITSMKRGCARRCTLEGVWRDLLPRVSKAARQEREGVFSHGFPPTLDLSVDPRAWVEAAAAAALPRPEIVHEERSYCTYGIVRIRVLADLGYRHSCA